MLVYLYQALILTTDPIHYSKSNLYYVAARKEVEEALCCNNLCDMTLINNFVSQSPIKCKCIKCKKARKAKITLLCVQYKEMKKTDATPSIRRTDKMRKNGFSMDQELKQKELREQITDNMSSTLVLKARLASKLDNTPSIVKDDCIDQDKMTKAKLGIDDLKALYQ